MLRDFVLYLVLASLFVLAELGMAYLDGYAFDWQVRLLQVVPTKFLTFWGHGGMHGDYWIINPIIAYVLARHATSWSLQGFAVIFFIVALVGMLLLIPLLEDSKSVASSLARDGFLPIAGAMHYLYYTVVMTISLAFYLLTPRSEVSTSEVASISIALAVHWSIGLLQPPYAVHGSIHLLAKITAVSGWVGLVVLAIWLIHFA